MNRNIKYCVGLNGRPGNLESILTEKAKDIYEVYAACPSGIAPTGRRGHVPIDLKELRRQVELAHEYGVRYNVLMNGSCFGGLEFSRSFQEKISSFVKYLDDIDADSTTVMNPFLIDIIRRNSQGIEKERKLARRAEASEKRKAERDGVSAPEGAEGVEGTGSVAAKSPGEPDIV